MKTEATSRSRSLAAAASAVLVLMGSPLAGQDASPVLGGTATPALGIELRAEALHAVAEGMKPGWAARRLVRRAHVLMADELERARTLQLAARLHWHDGNLEATRRLLTRAGMAAYRAGEADLAVRCFLDAADAAGQDGKKKAAWRAAQRAGKVIHASGFTPEKQLRLLARVVYTDQPAVLQTDEPLAEQ